MLRRKSRIAVLVSIFTTLSLGGLSAVQAGERWTGEAVLTFLSQHTCSFKVYEESGELSKEYDLNREMAESPDQAVMRDYTGEKIGAIRVAEHTTFLGIPISRTIAVITFEASSQGLALHIADEGIDVGVRERNWTNLTTFSNTDFAYETEDFMTKQRQVFRCN